MAPVCLRSRLILLAPAMAAASSGLSLPIGGAQCGRKYEGIGGLLNSDAPWLRGYPEPQRSEILDVLFKPQYAGSLQCLKLEVGGDGHSTINTESSHMHTEDEEPSFKRGWVMWLLQEAVRRNPDIKVGGLSWTWPGWTKGSVSKKVGYLVKWVQGIKANFNVTIDFMGLQNEGEITGGNAVFAVALRQGLDAAGFHSTIVDCCDSHSFSFIGGLANKSSSFFKAVGALAVHEPLRNVESVPAAALATGKPIWSSESYTTYSDSKGGGCWARAINWGYVKGNLTRHMAWNLIQSYPTAGDGMNYNGHGLTWASQPTSGHYTVAPPIWVSAHYTQATKYGWHFLPVGAGSDMLAKGGSYVSLVSDGGCDEPQASSDAGGVAVDLTVVLQTMEHDMSECFKDTHPEFTVVSQNVTYTIAPALLAKLRKPQAGGPVILQVRRTELFADAVIDPNYYVIPALRKNVYFEEQPSITVPASGSFQIALGVNEIVTLTTVTDMSRGDGSPGSDLGLPPIPNTTMFPPSKCSALTSHPVDAPLVDAILAMDQQGVWESRPSRESSLAGQTTMQMVITEECDEWHSGSKFKFPQTFVGPPLNTSSGTVNTISCMVLPPGIPNGWVGIGIGGQSTSGSIEAPPSDVLALWSSGKWSFNGHTGQVATSSPWQNLTVSLAHGLSTGWIDSKLVAQDPSNGSTNVPFAFLAASYSTEAGNHVGPDHAATVRRGNGNATVQSNAEFKDLCLNVNELIPAQIHAGAPPSPPGPPGPAPAPMKGHGLGLADCDASDARQLWTFSGEDRGEAGTLIASSNTSMCLGSAPPRHIPVQMRKCGDIGTAAHTEQLWSWDSLTGILASQEKYACIVASHGEACAMCLDEESSRGRKVDIFDCKNDLNQKWKYTPNAGASLFKKDGLCLTLY
eukprot:SAG11_NODE_205_length_12427_cov_8.010140_7_plen_910_part_00